MSASAQIRSTAPCSSGACSAVTSRAPMLYAASRSPNQNWATNSAPAITTTTGHEPRRNATSTPTTTTYSSPIRNMVVTMRVVRPRSATYREWLRPSLRPRLRDADMARLFPRAGTPLVRILPFCGFAKRAEAAWAGGVGRKRAEGWGGRGRRGGGSRGAEREGWRGAGGGVGGGGAALRSLAARKAAPASRAARGARGPPRTRDSPRGPLSVFFRVNSDVECLRKPDPLLNRPGRGRYSTGPLT